MQVLALDIGGANIKAARAHVDAAVHDLQAIALPFALWREPQRLADMLGHAASLLGEAEADADDAPVAITMTAELCDCFPTRADGVHHILQQVAAFAHRRLVGVWSVQGRFLPLVEAAARPLEVASANWHAQATHIARAHPDRSLLLIDTGSTTTDIIPIRDGTIRPRGLTDEQRLTTGELIYTGATRTPLAAVMNEWCDENQPGQPHRIMAEHFATTEDVHTLLGSLPSDDQSHTDTRHPRPDTRSPHPTADGRPMTPHHAAARILRMVGSDLTTATLDHATTWARRFADRQTAQIAAAIRQVLAGHPPEAIIISGSGAFIAHQAAVAALPNCEIIHWRDIVGPQASIAACATALLHLWPR